MRAIPIRLQVTAAFAAAMAVVLTLVGWLLYARVGSHLASSLDRDLRLRAQDLAALVDEPDASLARAGGGRFVERGEAYAELLDESGRVLVATPQLRSQPLLTPAELLRARRATIMANRETVPGMDEDSRLLATPIVRRGQRLVLLVGASRKDNEEPLTTLRVELFVAGPIALLLASLAGYGLAGMALRPVESMRRRAARISADTTGERLPVSATGDELQRLGETLNAMLGRLEAGLERERNFVADAGHELRTPLALLRTELELALHEGETAEELREAVRSASDEAERLARLAEDLLVVARSDQGRLSLRVETIRAAALLETVVTRFSWRADETGRELVVEAPSDLTVRGDRLRLEQALGNLVDNAIRHGAGVVRLSGSALDGDVELHVADEGPGFPEAFLEHAFERFSRADEARARGGAGLGLSIVRSIARAHEGDAHATNRDVGGADVWLVLRRPDRRD